MTDINHSSLFQKGLAQYNVILGDSNLQIDLPFGVQELQLLHAVVHENYDRNDDHHFNDIGRVVLKNPNLFLNPCSSLVGFLTLRTPARLDQTVCLLCLPPPDRDYSGHNCTVTGYGRPGLRGRTDYWSDTTTDGILREAHLAVRGDAACRDLWRQEVVPGGGPGPEGPVNMTTFICAGGQGDEEACYVSGNVQPLHLPLLLCC